LTRSQKNKKKKNLKKKVNNEKKAKEIPDIRTTWPVRGTPIKKGVLGGKKDGWGGNKHKRHTKHQGKVSGGQGSK